jgi:uncharacterized protein
LSVLELCRDHAAVGERVALAAPAQVSRAGRVLLAVFSFYRRWLSPLKGRPTCRYLPTCSEYGLEAVKVHGAAKGGLMTAARILRCNPLFHAGYHPVPKAGTWKTGEPQGH